MTLRSAAERRAQRKVTEYFIDADPLRVVLYRQDKVPNGTGGFVLGTPVPLPPQKVKVVPPNRQLEERQTLDGEIVRPNYIMLGYWDADIRRGDWFTWNGSRYDVIYVHEKTDYETKCEVLYRGGPRG